MITASHVAKAEYIIDNSSVVDLIFSELRVDHRGVKPKESNLRLMLIGIFLSIHLFGSATMTDVYILLTKKLETAEQVRLGVRRQDDLKLLINLENFYYFTKTINHRLNYGRSVVKLLGDDEILRRHDVIATMCDRMMDVFQLGWTSDTNAMDATGLWAWGKGKKKPKKVKKDAKGKGAALVTEEEAAMDEAVLLETGRGFEMVDPDDVPEELKHKIGELNDAAVDSAGLGHDPDAAWGYKTAKVDGVEIFYGMQEHTLVQTPAVGDKSDKEPRLIVRFEVAPANQDVTDVSLALLDRSPRRIKWLLADKLYHHQRVEDWQIPLLERDIFQIHDLRKDEQGFTEFERMRFAGGCGHCPATADEHGVIFRPPPNAPTVEHENFGVRVELRSHFAMQVLKQPDASGTARYRCPALEGSIGCPLREGSMQAALEAGKPRIQNPPNAERDGEPLPLCCTQDSVQVTLPTQIFKLSQRLYWGSKKWTRRYKQRTYVEGSYGNRKNNSTENLRRGLHRLTGMANVHLIMAMVNASYNLRMLNNWHERQAAKSGHRCDLCKDGLHPLLTEIVEPAAVLHLNAEQHSKITQWLALSIA